MLCWLWRSCQQQVKTWPTHTMLHMHLNLEPSSLVNVEPHPFGFRHTKFFQIATQIHGMLMFGSCNCGLFRICIERRSSAIKRAMNIFGVEGPCQSCACLRWWTSFISSCDVPTVFNMNGMNTLNVPGVLPFLRPRSYIGKGLVSRIRPASVQ